MEDALYLDTLCVNDGRGHYPKIHGIEATPGRYDAFEYAGLQIHIPIPVYSVGTVLRGSLCPYRISETISIWDSVGS